VLKVSESASNALRRAERAREERDYLDRLKQTKRSFGEKKKTNKRKLQDQAI
jgi:hypothetical protein